MANELRSAWDAFLGAARKRENPIEIRVSYLTIKLSIRSFS